MDEGILANIARQLVEVMRRDVRTDWTVRDDVRLEGAFGQKRNRLEAPHDKDSRLPPRA